MLSLLYVLIRLVYCVHELVYRVWTYEVFQLSRFAYH
jgi:hypothetical protein